MKEEQLELELRAAQKRIAELEAIRVDEGESHFARIFHASPTQMALTDGVSGKYVDVNVAFLRTLGFAREEVVGKTALELNLFIYAGQRRELLQRMAVQGYLRDESVLVRTKSGEVRHGIFSAEYIRSSDQTYLLTVMNDVTEKLEAEERWRFALEGAGDGVWDCNAQTNRVFFSRAWKAMLGYEEDEIGDSLEEWSSRVHPDDLAGALEKMDAHLKGETPFYTSEHRVRCKDGSYKWILARGAVVERTDDHQPRRVIGTHKDIAEQKQAEQHLRQSEQHYHSLVDALDVSLCRWLPDTTLTYANERYKKIFGVEGDGVGQQWLTFLPEEARASTAAFYGDIVEHPRTITYEHPVTVEGGSVREYQWTDTPILDEHGAVLEFQSVGIDITERKHAEAFVASNEAQIRGLLNATPDAMLIVNTVGEIVMANARTESILGYSQSDLIGSLVDQLLPTLVRENHIKNRAGFMANPRTITAGADRAIYVLRKDGSQFPAEISLSHHTMPGGEAVVLCSIRDVTERMYTNTLIAAQRDLARLTSAGLSKEDVWRACFQIALRASGLDCGGIYLFNKEERALELLHHEGLSAEFTHAVARFTEGAPNTRVILSGDTVFFADSDLSAHSHNRAEGLRALAVIPICHHGETLGCLNIGSHHITSIPELSREVLETLAVEIGNIIIHHQTQEALRSSRKQLNQALLAARMGTWRWHIPTNRMEWSPEAAQLFGVDPGQNDFGNVLERFHPDDRVRLIESIQEAFTKKRMLQLEYRIVSASGQIVWVTTYGNIEYDIDDKPLTVTGLIQDITERKQAETALRESEARYRSLIDSQESAISTIDADGVFHYMNGTGAAPFGTPEFVVGKTLYDLFPPHIAAWQLAQVRQVIASGQGVVHEYKSLVANQPSWRRVSIQPIHRADSSATLATVNSLDITDRKQAEEELRESEQRYRDLLNGMNDTVWVIDDDMRILDVNNATTAVLSYTREELLSMRISDIDAALSPEDMQHMMNNLPQGKFQVFETRFITKDGREIPVEVKAGLVSYIGKTVIMGIARDITERKRAQEELQLTEQRYRAMIENAPDGIVLIDATGKFTYASPSVERIFGYTQADMPACDSASMTHPEDLPTVLAALARLLETPTYIPTLQYRFLHKSGEWRWIESTFSNLLAMPNLEAIIINFRDIHERRLAEADLRASEEKYRGLMESLDNAVSTVDAEGRFLYMNDMAAEKLGGKPQDLIGKIMQDIFPEPLAGHQLAGVQQVFRTDQKAAFEAPSLGGEGLRWYRFTLQPLHDETGRVAQVLINATDIHDLKTAQQGLQELNYTLEERVRQRTAQVQDLYDNAPVGYHSLDAEGRFIAINQTELLWLGYAREELLGQPITSIYTAQTAETFPTRFARFKLTGQTSNQEAEAVRHDGTTFPVMINATAIYDAHGQYVSSRSTMTDITERKQAENELKRNINFINALLNAIPTPVFYKDKDGFYQGCNLAFAEIMGRASEQIRGKTVYEVWPSADAAIYHQKDLALMQSGERQIYEATVTDKDGKVRPVIFVKDIFYDESGGVAGLVGAFVDITERKHVEETLQRANAELQRAMRIKDEFLASMSHELRTPLNAILGLSQSMIEQFIGPLNDRQIHAMQTVEASGRHLLELINDILDLSKVAANQMTLEPAPVFVRGLCDASLLFVRETARKKYLQVTSVLDPAVEFMQADERRLKQILVNLLSNAVKFTPEGGAVELRVTGDSAKRAVRFSVSDTGIGIAPEHIEHLFQPFVQLDSGLNRQFEGTGLGLSLVARMTELHGGSVSVESEPGRGSTFTITLPWASTAPSPIVTEEQPAAPGPETARAFPLGRNIPLILIAEDNETNIAMLSTYLQARGYHLAIARNGDEALSYARAKRPDLILMDLQMPVLDGLEATRRLRGDSDPDLATIPVLALTALAMPADRRRAMEAGANAYLSKPVDLKQLADLITRLTEEQCDDIEDPGPR